MRVPRHAGWVFTQWSKLPLISTTLCRFACLTVHVTHFCAQYYAVNVNKHDKLVAFLKKKHQVETKALAAKAHSDMEAVQKQDQEKLVNELSFCYYWAQILRAPFKLVNNFLSLHIHYAGHQVKLQKDCDSMSTKLSSSDAKLSTVRKQLQVHSEYLIRWVSQSSNRTRGTPVVFVQHD